MKYRRKYIKEKILIRDMYKKNLFVSIIYMSACSFSCKNIDQDNQVSKNISMMLMSVCANVYISYLWINVHIYILFRATAFGFFWRRCSFLSIINISERQIFFLQFFSLFYFFFFYVFFLFPFDWYSPKLCLKNWNGENVLQKKVKKESQFWNEKKSMMFYYFLPNIR